MIDRGDIRQAIDRCSNIWASLPGAGYIAWAYGWQLDCKIRESGRNRMWMMCEQSLRLSPLWLSASSSARHGLLIITVITPLPTKPSATKMNRTEAGERGNYWHADASAWCCCARCKIHEGVSFLMLKLKMMLCVMMLPLVVVGCEYQKAVCQSVREANITSGVDNAAWLADTAGTGLFHQREADHYAKTTGRNPEVY